MEIPQRVLIVDDDLQNRQLLVEALSRPGHEVVAATSGEDACQRGAEQEFAAVVCDIHMGAVSGLDVLTWFQENVPDTPVILLTAFGSVDTAIQAMKQGAFDYLTKPLNLSELTIIVDRAVKHSQLVRDHKDLREAFNQRLRATSVIAQSRCMLDIFKIVGKVAPTKASVLIYGESGTGKELIARAIHDNSPRAGHPFVPINCSAIPDSLLESELFGHVRGAFTDAGRLRTGLIEEASGGTFFLDEIGDLSLAGQGKLLRVLQEGEIRRIGSNTTIKVDLRIVAASRHDLYALVKEGRFREDFLYRVKTITIAVPPLRERKEDIPLLANLFVSRYGGGKNVKGFSDGAMKVLLHYDWPGNVRELEHVVEQSVTLATHPILSAEDLPKEIQDSVTKGSLPPDSSGARQSAAVAARRKVSAMTRDDVIAMYRSVQGNKLQLAHALGISRWAAYRLLEKYDVEGKSQPDNP